MQLEDYHLNDMRYLEIEDYFEYIFDSIRNLVYDDTQKPFYENEKRNIGKLEHTLETIKNNYYYPNYYKKAAFLMVTLSTGHNFSNGNKRIALFSYAYFSYINGYTYRRLTQKIYTKWFKIYFPNYKLKRYKFYNNYAWGLYNFNKAINIKEDENPQRHSYTFNELKDIAENFI